MDLVWPAAAWALWAATLAAAFKVSSRDRHLRPSGEPVAVPVAELLRGMRAQEVFHATVFELAGRGWLRAEGDRFSLGDQGPGQEEPPAAYERWVLERVRARLAGAPDTPEIELMPHEAELDGQFVPLVRRRAIELGLARRRWPSMLVPVLLAAGLVVPWYATIAAAGLAWPGMIATMVSLVAGIGLLMGGRGFLLTERGREIARTGPANPRQEWIFTGSGWQGGEIVPAGPPPQGSGRQEVAGYVVKRWTDETGEHHYVALHDGSSRTATAFEVEQAVYQDVLPGDQVRLLVRPRTGIAVRMLAHDRHR
ncbi:hypothetical protein [Nonomuraea candida]|uniref:hypothetical protein n=1 Tax=Nonomuraea candida TaxID=359159 RepID=UPI0005BA511C|nr:hypothetical protein [Nonomuraea candida]